MSAADPTIAERERRYKEAQKKRGMKMCRVWVPEEDIDKLKHYARLLREGREYEKAKG